jgi:parallel beta-helix repeat protein
LSEKKKVRSRVFSLLILIIFLLLFLGQYTTKIDKINIDDQNNEKNPKNSEYWDLTGSPVYIDGNNEWITVSNEEWCTGSGTLGDPYVLKNIYIDGQNSSSCIIIKNSNVYFMVENCTLYNSAAGSLDAGIRLENVINGILFQNNCSLNNNNGITLINSSEITISNNIINNNKVEGILCSDNSNYNTISKNFVSNNENRGIWVIDCQYNTISENTITYTIVRSGIELENSNENTIIGNIVNDGKGIYLRFSHNNSLSGNTAHDNSDNGIYLYYSTYNTIQNSNVSNNFNGISIGTNSHYNTVLRNTATSNRQHGIGCWNNNDNTIADNTAYNNSRHGISLSNSHNNNITGNTASNNSRNGVTIDNSDNSIISRNILRDNSYGVNITVATSEQNLVYDNYFIENGQHAYDVGTNNNWNSTLLGNYWDDHNTTDNDKDGIDDLPYSIPGTAGSEDKLPIHGNPFHNGRFTYIFGHETSGNKSWNDDPYIIKDLIIDAQQKTCPLLIINSSNIVFRIENCELYNSRSSLYDAGIKLEYTSNGTLFNNNCSSNFGHGIALWESDYNNISGNNLNANVWFGYGSWNSHYNIISNNTIENNHDNGIFLHNSSKNTILENQVFDNDYNGISIGDLSKFNVISKNNVSWHDQAGIGCWKNYNNTVSGNIIYNNVWGIYLSESNCINILENTAKVNTVGLKVVLKSNHNDVLRNTFDNNLFEGIALEYGNNNTILRNTISNNADCGIKLYSQAKCNLVFLNDFLGNTINARDYGTDNQWNNETIGNYWSDYPGKDTDDNSIGDDPYDIPGTSGSSDQYPIWWDPPVLSIHSPIEDEIFEHNPPEFNISIDEGYVNSTWYTLNNGFTNTTFTELTGTIDSFIWNSLGSGNIILTFYANDSIGDEGFSSVTIQKDIDAPIIIINSPYQDEIIGLTAPDVNLTIVDPNFDSVWYSIDNGIINITLNELTGKIDQNEWNKKGAGLVNITFYANDTLGRNGIQGVVIEKNYEFWPLDPVIIDNKGNGDYTWLQAAAQGWCSGSGTSMDPYIIESLKVNGVNSKSCIEIKDSNSFFTIIDCTCFNSGTGLFDAGIKLSNVTNGYLIQNNCSFNNNYGIVLEDCVSITLSENSINYNEVGGIFLSYSDSNVISYNLNTINNNGLYGIYLIFSNDNNIYRNTINSNKYGIYLHQSNNNSVVENTLIGNLKGIEEIECMYNYFDGNFVQDIVVGGDLFLIVIIVVISIICTIGVAAGVILWKGKFLFKRKKPQKRKLEIIKAKMDALKSGEPLVDLEITPPFEAYVGDEPYLFVSYAHANKKQVYPILNDLYESGVRIWYDEGIPAASNWIEQIADTILESKYFLVFITPHALKSENVRDEIHFAKTEKKRIFTVYLEETEIPPEIRLQLGRSQAIFKYKLTEEKFWEKLTSQLSEVRIKPMLEAD